MKLYIFLATLAYQFCFTNSAIYNAACDSTEYCTQIYTQNYICEEGHCIRKPFTFDNSQEYLGGFLIIFISMFANAGGLGAGAVIIPVYIFIYKGFHSLNSLRY